MVELNIHILTSDGFKHIDWVKKSIVPLPEIRSFEFNEPRNYKQSDQFDLTRLCELELTRSRWYDINLFPFPEEMKLILAKFTNYFILEAGFYTQVGVLLIKLKFRAVKTGVCDLDEIGKVILKIVKEDEEICNEIRAKTLLFDKSSKLEMRVGDSLTFYLTKEITVHYEETI